MFGALTLLTSLVAIQDAGKPPRILRSRDAGALFARRGNMSLDLDLCPAAAQDERSRDSDHVEELLDIERVAPILQQVAEGGGARDFKWRASWTGRGASLDLTATAEVQEQYARLLEGLEEALLGEERLEVRALVLRDGAAATAGALLLDEAEADRREKDLLGSGRATVQRVATAALPDAFAIEAQQVEAGLFARDFAVEICHGSAIHDPIIGVDSVGLSLAVRAARLPDATWLDLAVREVEAAAPPRVVLVEPKAWFTSPDPHEGSVLNATREDLSAATFDAPIPLRIEAPQHAVTSFADSFVIPNGKVLWIPSRVTTQAEAVACVVEVRVHGPFRPLLHRFTFDANRVHGVSIVHLGALQSLGFRPTRYDRTSLSTPLHDRSDLRRADEGMNDPWWPSLAVAEEPGEDPFGAVAELRARFTDRADCVVRMLSRRDLLIIAPAASGDEVAQIVREQVVALSTFELNGRIIRGDATVAEFLIPAVAAKPVTLWSGVASSHLAGWGVDVANESVVGNPEMRPFLDGFGLTFIVRPGAGGKTRIAVNGALCFLDAPPMRTSLGSAYTPCYEKLRARRLLLDETRAVDAGGAPAPLRFGGSSLALELTVTPGVK